MICPGSPRGLGCPPSGFAFVFAPQAGWGAWRCPRGLPPGCECPMECEVRPGHPYGPQVTGETKGLMTASKAFTTNMRVATAWETLRTWPTSCSWTVDLHQVDGLSDLAVSMWCRRSARGGAHPRPSACCVTSQASKHALCGPPSPASPPWWTSWHSERREAWPARIPE